MEASAIDGEIERIQRTVKLIGDENAIKHQPTTPTLMTMDANQVTFEVANASRGGPNESQYHTNTNAFDTGANLL